MRPRLPKLEVYTFSTPNSVKVPIALEELALDYTLHPVNMVPAGGRRSGRVAAELREEPR